MSHQDQKHGAFTLVELLVVIAIIGVLVALLLPAVQAARESARQGQCKNQLKQLALGSLNHHDVQGHFQTGGWGWYWVGDPDRGFGDDQPGGWIFNTLSFIEQEALHDMGTDGKPDEYTSRIQGTGAEFVVQHPLSTVNCPSRRAAIAYPMSTNAGGNAGLQNSKTPDEAGRSDYAINSGDAFNEFPSPAGAGPTSYDDIDGFRWGGEAKARQDGTSYKTVLNGISFERSAIKIRQITDGTTNTYLIGEKYIPVAEYETGMAAGDNETWCTGFNNDNYRITGYNGGVLGPISDSTDPATASERDRRFGSAHPATWNVSFCDGSVRSLSFDIDGQTHRNLGARDDGNITFFDN